MLLTIQNIQKYFGAELCLRNISCVLDAQDRAGIIGENGAGKTTLIKIITGELYPDDGIVTLAHGATVGYLEQNSVLDPACTVYGEMENAFRSVLDAMDEMKRLERQMAECPGDHMLLERHAQLSAVVDAADGYNMDTQIKKILNGMAFPAPDYQKSVAVLSGGEHTRLCLAKLLLQKPDPVSYTHLTEDLKLFSAVTVALALSVPALQKKFLKSKLTPVPAGKE